MKIALALAVLVIIGFMVASMALAANEPDRIFITRLRPFVLQPSTNRPDHREFFIQIFTQSHRHYLTKTNTLLTVHDLQHVPDGPAVLVVQSICSDGEKSPEIPFDIDIRKSPPRPPKIHPIVVTEEEATAKTMEDLRFIRRREMALRFPAPAPPGAIPIVIHPAPPPVLPNATNRPYLPQLRRNQ